jgi:plasmid replication initiation protein
MSLRPEHHPVGDLFVCDVLDVVPRSDMASMAHPVFSLSSKPDMRTLRYEMIEGDETVFIEIQPSAKGLATVHDKDILIYAVSKLMNERNQGGNLKQTVRITAHDYFVSTNRKTGGSIGGILYKRLEDALDRLAGTRIKTNIKTGDEKETKNFGLIDAYDYNRKGSGHGERLRYLDIKLSDWLFRAIKAADVLTISRDYFRLRSPLDRRIYEIARKHCGSQEKWRISIDKLQKRTGSKQARKHFDAHLRALAKENHLPDYAVTIEGEQVVFWRRESDAAGRAAAVVSQVLLDKKTDSAAAVSGSERKIMISSDAIEEAKRIAPRTDPYYLESTYIAWAKKLSEPAKNEDARYLSWVRSFTKNKLAS